MGCCFSESSNRKRPEDKDPLGRRRDVGCTDPICCVIFLLFLLGLGLLTIYAYIHGDIRRVTNNYDCYGNVCGKEVNSKLMPNNSNSGLNTSDKPFIYHTYSASWKYSRRICVSKCPDKYLSSYAEVKQFAIDTKSKLCDYDIPIDKIDSKNHAAGLAREKYFQSPCPILPVEPQIDLLGFCIRNNISQVLKRSQISKISDVNEITGINQLKPILESLVRDFILTWREIIILSAGSFVLSFIMVIFIRYLASAVVYMILFLTIVVSIGLTIFLWLCYCSQQDMLSLQFSQQIKLLIGDVFNTRSFLYMSITSTIITVVVLLVIMVMWKRILVVTFLFREASKCLGHIPSLMFQPIFTLLVLAAFFFYWCLTFGFLMSIAGHEISNRTGCVKYLTAKFPKYVWLYFIVGLVWVSEFILAGQQMIIAGTVSQWYFLKQQTKSGRSTVTCPVFKSTMRFLFQHSGSVAFGSLIITLVRIPRWFLMYVSKKLKTGPTGESTCIIECCAKFCIGCLYCVEKCLKYLNKNAYAIIAIEGCSFCPAAQRSFVVLVSNFLRVAALNSVGDFILFLGKLCVSFISAGAAVIVFMRRDDLYFYPIPVLVVAIIAFFFAHGILSLYETVLDVLLICFCVDEETRKQMDTVDSTVGDVVRSESHDNLKKNLMIANDTLNRVSGRAPEKSPEEFPLA